MRGHWHSASLHAALCASQVATLLLDSRGHVEGGGRSSSDWTRCAHRWSRGRACGGASDSPVRIHRPVLSWNLGFHLHLDHRRRRRRGGWLVGVKGRGGGGGWRRERRRRWIGSGSGSGRGRGCGGRRRGHRSWRGRGFGDGARFGRFGDGGGRRGRSRCGRRGRRRRRQRRRQLRRWRWDWLRWAARRGCRRRVGRGLRRPLGLRGIRGRGWRVRAVSENRGDRRVAVGFRVAQSLADSLRRVGRRRRRRTVGRRERKRPRRCFLPAVFVVGIVHSHPARRCARRCRRSVVGRRAGRAGRRPRWWRRPARVPV